MHETLDIPHISKSAVSSQGLCGLSGGPQNQIWVSLAPFLDHLLLSHARLALDGSNGLPSSLPPWLGGDGGELLLSSPVGISRCNEGRKARRKEGRKEGRKDGRNEERKEGRKKGRTEARKQGRKEGRKKGFASNC